MTAQQVASLNIGFDSTVSDIELLMIESGFEWVLNNTSLEFDMTDDSELQALPACVKLFVRKFVELNSTIYGVTSESIEGLSQSFDSNTSDLVWKLAEELLDKYLNSRVYFVAAKNRWKQRF